jgi:thioredoxin 1
MIDATSESFNEEISIGNVLVDFHGQSCAPCRAMGMILKNCQQEFDDMNVKVVKVDINECPEIAQRFGVSSIPTIQVFVDGEPIEGFVGMKTKGQVISIIEEALK